MKHKIQQTPVIIIYVQEKSEDFKYFKRMKLKQCIKDLKMKQNEKKGNITVLDLREIKELQDYKKPFPKMELVCNMVEKGVIGLNITYLMNSSLELLKE